MISKDVMIRTTSVVFASLFLIGIITHNSAFEYAAVAFLVGCLMGVLIMK